MKNLFFAGLFLLMVFEILNVYFIMPLPGSQQMNSVDLAYLLYRWRWTFRIIFGVMIAIGFFACHFKNKWIPLVLFVLLFSVVYGVNFQMAADHMFYQPNKVLMVNATNNKVDNNRLVLGIVNNGEAKAYPIQFLGFHHQIKDNIGGKPVLVTYCTVCRTGRVYEPIINGKEAQFRLVGMDHFNAMLEDAATKSWWQQATGQAITGKMKGTKMPEFFSTQTSLEQWLQLNPQSLIMQADPAFASDYDSTFKFETGKSTSKLTGTDSLSGKEKSWVIGVKAGSEKKAYDWNTLKAKRIINDKMGSLPIALVLSKDDKSFFAFERPDEASKFNLINDTIVLNNHHYKINGTGIDTSFSLKQLPAYQEFWHSWKFFNKDTSLYKQ